MKIKLTLVVFLFASTMLQSSAVSVRAQEGSVQVIELTAKKYEFSPGPVHVRAGTKVQLKITAIDHDHGIEIPTVPDGTEKGAAAGIVLTDPQKCYRLKKGETTTVELEAKTAGTYTFKCCHLCGLGHHGMKGQLVVE
jgi:heme/copper-type cytochrome/quinol oxidase subunit 2